MLSKYKKTTDVQQTWREHGWSPPSEDPDVRSRWAYFRTLDTERANDQGLHRLSDPESDID
jgi:hypothetical protein